MSLKRLHEQTQELDTPRGKALMGLHLVAWDALKAMPFPDQIWVINGLVRSLKKRQEMHYCTKCSSTDCQHHKEQGQ